MLNNNSGSILHNLLQDSDFFTQSERINHLYEFETIFFRFCQKIN